MHLGLDGDTWHLHTLQLVFMVSRVDTERPEKKQRDSEKKIIIID